jgi:hypothetical protein
MVFRPDQALHDGKLGYYSPQIGRPNGGHGLQQGVPLFKKHIQATVDVLKFLRPGQCLPLLFAELKPRMVLSKPMLQLGPAILKASNLGVEAERRRPP